MTSSTGAPVLLVVVVTGLLARLLVVALLPVPPFSDFAEYLKAAVQLALLGHLQGLSAMHPPGYPLVLAVGLRLAAGVDPVLAAKLVNCALGVATVWLGARLTHRVAGEPAAVLAAVVLAFHPRALLMPAIFASENLFAPLLFAFLLILPRKQVAPDPVWRVGAAGALIGWLALTRSVAYFLGGIWLVAALAAGRRPSRILRDLAVVLLVQHAVLLPWGLRNQRDMGRFTLLTVSGGMGMFNGTNENATGFWYPWMDDLERLRPGISLRPNVEIDQAAREEAIRFARRHPARAFGLYVRRLRIIAEQDDLIVDWTFGLLRPYHGRWPRLAVRVAATVIAVAGLPGVIWLVARTRRDRDLVPLTAGYLGTMAYIYLLSAVVAVNGRYRWPIEDLLVPLGAAFICRVAARRKSPDGPIMS